MPTSAALSDIDSAALRQVLGAHQAAQPLRAILQVASTFLPFVALVAAMYLTAHISFWLTLALAVPTAAFVVRIFIVRHDCGHGAPFSSRRVNDWIGRLCSLATLTPYQHWRRQHAGHHANWNNLDRRESGTDIYSTCLTTAEYRRLARRERASYRILRHPLIAHLLLPPLVFMVLYRLSFDTPAAWWRERRSVHATNVALVALFVLIGLFVGFDTMAQVQLPIITLAAIAGVWLFSVQHRFEAAAWLRRIDWTSTAASLRGTSYLRLPQPPRWFTGDIGFHHVHHLNPKIPNYRLAKRHAGNATLRSVATLSLLDGLRAPSRWLWDEERGRMVSFADAGRPSTR